VAQVEVIAGVGISGDAYAGPGDRQLVFFEDTAREALERAEEAGLCYARFFENVRVSGLELAGFTEGDRLALGEAEVEITSARKRCYAECTLTPDGCLIRGHVAFARVTNGGRISVGDAVTPVDSG
jgi:MOSC domain-containing protein YiiM